MRGGRGGSEGGRNKEEREREGGREKQRGGVVRESGVDEGTAAVVPADSRRLPQSSVVTGSCSWLRAGRGRTLLLLFLLVPHSKT